MNVLFLGHGDFPVSYSNRDTAVERLKSSFRKLYGRYGGLMQQYEVFLANGKWHSNPWSVTVIVQPIRLSTNFMIGSRERLPFRSPGSVPILWLAYAPIVETSFLNLPCLFFIFRLGYPLVLSRFCSWSFPLAIIIKVKYGHQNTSWHDTWRLKLHGFFPLAHFTMNVAE